MSVMLIIIVLFIGKFMFNLGPVTIVYIYFYVLMKVLVRKPVLLFGEYTRNASWVLTENGFHSVGKLVSGSLSSKLIYKSNLHNRTKCRSGQNCPLILFLTPNESCSWFFCYVFV